MRRDRLHGTLLACIRYFPPLLFLGLVIVLFIYRLAPDIQAFWIKRQLQRHNQRLAVFEFKSNKQETGRWQSS